MILKSLTLQHFRQFYGTQKLTFGANEDGAVTVILGENGRGKTGIYRAIIFGLYGEQKLEQDSNDANVTLANTKALQADFEGVKKGVEAKVMIEFQHTGVNYVIERSLLSIMDESRNPVERVQKVTLINLDSKEVYEDEMIVNDWMDNILDRRVKGYFFFDGERIERLTRASVEQRSEISSGIKNLLKIDHLVKARQVLIHLQKQTTKQLEKHSTGDYKKRLQEKVEIEDKLDAFARKKEDLLSYGSQQDHQLAKIEKDLTRYEGKMSEFDKRAEIEAQLEKEEQEAEYAFRRLQEFNSKLPYMLAKNTLYAVKSQIDAYLGAEIEDVSISIDLVENLLNDLTCICGDTFKKDSSQYQALQSLKKAAGYKLEKAEYFDLKANVMKLIGFLEDKENQLQHLLEQLEREQQEVEDLKVKLDSLNRKLKETKIDDLYRLNKEREEVYENRIKVKYQLQELEEQMHELHSAKEQNELALASLKVKSGVHKQLVEKQEELEKAIVAMDKLLQEFEKDVISELESLSTQNFKYLLDENGQRNIKSVQVEDDYSLEVLNVYNHPFLANISQGQRQVLSLSFITALAQVAGGNDTLEMPLFMDTPFGRLSDKHQNNLLDFIPNVCSQWVLLVTDREFSLTEQEQFINSGQVGKFYKLISEEASTTKIQEQTLEMVGGIV
jgi:DNA sulfur modification protein DndD